MSIHIVKCEVLKWEIKKNEKYDLEKNFYNNFKLSFSIYLD